MKTRLLELPIGHVTVVNGRVVMRWSAALWVVDGPVAGLKAGSTATDLEGALRAVRS